MNDIEKTIETLELFNRWRRDDEGEFECPGIKEIGIAIDEACEGLKKMGDLLQKTHYNLIGRYGSGNPDAWLIGQAMDWDSGDLNYSYEDKIIELEAQVTKLKEELTKAVNECIKLTHTVNEMNRKKGNKSNESKK